MQSPPAFPPDAPTLTEGAQAWSMLCERLRQRARLDAEIVELTGQVQRSGTIEALEGVTLDTALNLVHRLPGADRSMQLTAADVLADMPATSRLFKTMCLSWGQVRGIVAEAKRLSRADRAVLDTRIAASADLFAKMDPDDAIDAVRVAAQELRDIAKVEREEDRDRRSNFVWGQPGMFGPGKLYGELDNVALACALGGMDAAAPGDDGRSVSQRRADGLVALATHRCPVDSAARDDATCGDTHAGATAQGMHDAGSDDPAGGGTGADSTASGHGASGGKAADDPAAGGAAAGASRPTSHRRLDRAQPAFLTLVDFRDVSVTAAGTIQLNAPGCLPTLTARAVEALAADATVQVVLCDGARPLTVTRKMWATDIPADVRLAVKARDGGDRFPGSRAPIGHVHHLDKRGRGHDPDYLLGTSPVSHRRIHRSGWSVTIDPPTGEVTFTRGERRWTTVPRGTRLRRPPPGTGDEPSHHTG